MMRLRIGSCLGLLALAMSVSGCSSSGQSSTPGDTQSGINPHGGSASGTPPLETGVDPASIVGSVNPLAFRYRTFDTVGDGKIHAIIVGDYNQNGVLEWDDINAVIPLLCDPNKLDSDGKPFCGTLYIPRGNWLSRTTLDPDVNDLTDDQIYVYRPRKFALKGSGIDATTFTVRYSRADYCLNHHGIAGGGVFLFDPQDNIELSDFTYVGLPGRTWGSKTDCSGHGEPPNQWDPGPRNSQTGINLYATSGSDYKHNLTVRNIKVAQVDYLGFIISNWQNVRADNLIAQNYGATGFNISSIKDAVITNLFASSSQSTLTEAGLNIESERDGQGLPQPLKLENLLLDGYTCRDNYRGLSINALGGGGVANVTIRNVDIQGIGMRRPEWAAFPAMGIAFSDADCKWDAQNVGGQHLGPLTDKCYINGVIIDGGTVRNVAGSGISSYNLAANGPGRNITLRGLTLEAVGIKLGGNDSQGVSLFGGVPHGTDSKILVENTTITGVDADGNGIPDLSQLMRIDSADYAVIRNNTFKGKTQNGPSTFLDLTNISNATVSGNSFTVEQPNGTGILLGNGATQNVVQGNSIALPVGGSAIIDFTGGVSNQVLNNTVTP
ncbi:right-handed parallel beta-helix repeat-containing protein [Geobacter pickeringii]|uniref:Probable pectate lyase C n=1 Tax=Geobacter pickeringii TaxID=345632 RepID=A0A0B5BGS3_9BACT|nr:right-handed parallel beta-helix repeat-containing protein [Geobacter pickeringii]AJE03251.1 hypothetical protein GPICK_07710 [Geobacter pickeringii]